MKDLPADTPAQSLRQQLCLNGLWDFKCDADEDWTRIRVPGPYTGVTQSWGAERWDAFGHPPHWLNHGAVYKRSIQVPADMQGMQIRFRCDGCFHHTRLIVNGTEAGEWHDGYMPFEFRIDHLLKDGDNELQLVVAPYASDLFDDYRRFCRGIWEDTFLTAYGDIAIEDDTFVTTSVKDSTISYESPVSNASDESRRIVARNTVRDAEGNTALTFDGEPIEVPARSTVTCTCEAAWEDPILWFTHSPYLYHLVTVLHDEEGHPLDSKTIRFGFREVTWKGPHLYLNGHELFMRGHGGHYLGDIQGTREYMEAWLGGLKGLGVNFIRMHCHPKHSCMLDVADELGILVEAEAVFFFEVPKDEAIWKGHLDRLVRRYRNRPSVVIWSVSNELRWKGGGEKKELIEYVKTLDTTRPVFASDFSLESRHGDVVGHHYNPRQVFDEWEEFGPDKPMIWDELGWVWPENRPVNSGPAGYEYNSQDYATGLWHDGYDQILNDLAFFRDGKVINGELHRVNAFIPWDLSYVFFRWQPFNKNRTLQLPEADLEGPGIKLKKVEPISSTVNIWDPTLPVFEPNPGYYIFEQYMRTVRFFDTDNLCTFQSGREVTKTSRLFYEDLREVDSVSLRVELPDGEILWQTQRSFAVKPGEMVESFEAVFEIPEVDRATPVNMVRQFFFKNEPGYKDSFPATVFPAPASALTTELAGVRIGVHDPNGALSPVLNAMGVDAVPVTGPPGNELDVLVTGPAAGEHREAIDEFVSAGGRTIELALPEAGSTTGRRLIANLQETFETDNTCIYDGTDTVPCTTATGITWSGWAPRDGDKQGIIDMAGADPTGGNRDAHPFFRSTPVPGAYLYGDMPMDLNDMRRGRITLSFDNHYNGLTWDAMFKQAPDAYDRRIGFLIKDKTGTWYLSREEQALTLSGKQGSATAELADMTWDMVAADAKGDLPPGPLAVSPTDDQPDLSLLSGVGIYEYAVPGPHIVTWYLRMEWTGTSLPSAQVPLNGPKHHLLDGLTQRDFASWRNGSTAAKLAVPAEGRNSRTVLLGDKDGGGAALLETPVGRGARLACALNIVRDFDAEPAASWLLHNLLHYAARYAPGDALQAGFIGNKDLAQYFDKLGLVCRPIDREEPETLESLQVLLLDGRRELPGSWIEPLKAFLEAGKRILVYRANEQTAGFYSSVLDQELAMTDPFLGERSHCTKAAVSWTRSDTPPEPVEYYEGILIPQPFEPNYDPLISGMANRDLDWDGVDMFDTGIEIKGMDPVDVSDDYNILVSNWRIDWSISHFGGEYANACKDLRRARWFINRDPVVLKAGCGSRGFALFCQLDLPAGGERGARIACQLLTGLGCSLGRRTSFCRPEHTFDMQATLDQRERFARTRHLLEPATRVHYGSPPEILAEKDNAKSADYEAGNVLLIGNAPTLAYGSHAATAMSDTHECTIIENPIGTSTEALEKIPALLAEKEYSVIQLSLGLEDLRCGKDGKPVTDLDTYTGNLERIMEVLVATGAKLYWVPMIPLPAALKDYAVEEVDTYNEAARRLMDGPNVYVNDLHGFVSDNCPGFLEGSTLEFTDDQLRAIAERVASAIIFFGAQ